MRSISATAAASLIGLATAGLPALVTANEPLWDGLFTDGTRVTAGKIAGWAAPAAQPQFGGKPMFDAANPVRWVVRQGPPPPGSGPRQPFVELANGDRFPGIVEGHAGGREDWRRTTPPHLLVRPLVSVDLPGRPPRPLVRVGSELVRRIVLVPRVGPPPPPATILTREGREVGFRSLRFSGKGVIILGDEGTQKLSFEEIAEIRLADRDPWDTFVRLVAFLVPQAADGPAAAARLMRVETDDGLVATTAVDPVPAAGDPNNPLTWHLRCLPAWSLDPLWLPHAQVRRRIVFAATEVPLSLIAPAAVDRRATFGDSWTWERDRNVQGGPLSADRLPFGWGFGTQAFSALAFPLPEFATAFRAGAALDTAAGAGGCVRAAVHVKAADTPPLWQSPYLVGTRAPVDTGNISLPPAAGPEPRTLVLVADAAHEGRPQGADVHDIRDIFDWLDPVVSLAADRLAAAVRQRLSPTIVAWRDWDVVGQPALRTLVDPLAAPDMPATLRQSLLVGGETVLRRRLEVTPEMRYLVVGLSRTAASPSRFEIRIDGAAVAAADVPERKPGVAVLPFAFPLAGYTGRTIQVEVVHRGSDDKSFVEWAAVGLTDVLGTRWQTLTPVSAVSEGKATLRVLDDGSVLASGPSPATDVHVLEVETPLGPITALRLEALRDGSLPAGGPGRAADGNFVLQSVEAEAVSAADPARRRPLAFSKAEATHAQGGCPPVHLIDANPVSGWAVAGAPQSIDLAAVLTLAEPVGFAGGTRLKVTLRYQQGDQAVLGRFRLSATADPDPQLGPPATMLAPGSPAAGPPK